MMKTPPDGIFFSHEISPDLSEQKTLQESVLQYGEQVERLIQSGWRPDILHAHSVIYGAITRADPSAPTGVARHGIP